MRNVRLSNKVWQLKRTMKFNANGGMNPRQNERKRSRRAKMSCLKDASQTMGAFGVAQSRAPPDSMSDGCDSRPLACDSRPGIWGPPVGF